MVASTLTLFTELNEKYKYINKRNKVNNSIILIMRKGPKLLVLAFEEQCSSAQTRLVVHNIIIEFAQKEFGPRIITQY